MGKGRAKGHYGKLQRGYQGGQGVPWQPSRGQMGTGKAREMVTINPAMLSSLSSTTSSPSSSNPSYKTAPKAESILSSSSVNSSFYRTKSENTVEECVYACMLQEGMLALASTNGTKEATRHTLVVISDEILLDSVYGTLKPLFSLPLQLLRLSSKSSHQEKKRSISALSGLRPPSSSTSTNDISTTLITEPSCLSSWDHLPKLSFHTMLIVYRDSKAKDSPPFCKAVKLSSKVISLVKPTFLVPADCKEYNLEVSMYNQAATRISVARQLYAISRSGHLTVEQKNVKERSLKEKIKVLLNTNDSIYSDGSCRGSSSSSSTRRKMVILGMLEASSGSATTSSSGRDLARTQWLDGSIASEVPWDDVRCGASCDEISLKVKDIVQECKRFSTLKKLNRKLKTSVRNVCRVVGFEWNPNPFSANDEEWGGEYGKCCGHNEPCLQFVRPFYPQLVINTRVCSKDNPAPGNNGFEGCLEFLKAQCRFFHRPMTIWDIQTFHYIDSKGIHSTVEKQSLLSLPEAQLSMYMTNLKHLTLECEGKKPPFQLLRQIKDFSHLAEGNYRLQQKNGRKISLPVNLMRLICSFLMINLPPVSASAQEKERERSRKRKISDEGTSKKSAAKKIKTKYIVIDDVKIKV